MKQANATTRPTVPAPPSARSHLTQTLPVDPKSYAALAALRAEVVNQVYASIEVRRG